MCARARAIPVVAANDSKPGPLLFLELVIGERDRRGIEARIAERQRQRRRVIGVHQVQRTAKCLAELPRHADDAGIEIQRFGVRVAGIDRRQRSAGRRYGLPFLSSNTGSGLVRSSSQSVR